VKLYVDGSALVKLLIAEPESADALALWDSADRVVSAATLVVEGHAAIARRLSGRRVARAAEHLERRLDQMELSALDDLLLEDACTVARRFRLPALDALHLAAAARLADESLVFATWDRELSRAARGAGLIVAP
jgi:predicted nucleic acid-binding protein